MRFLPFLKRSDESRRSSRRVRPPPDLASVEQLRTRTRRRLIGSAVLVMGAVLLLPMALENTPRPPGAPVTIDMPARTGAAGPGAEALAPRAAPARPGEAAASDVGSALAAAAVPRPAPRVDGSVPRKLAAPASSPVARPAAERRAANAEKAEKADKADKAEKFEKAERPKATATRSDKPTPAKPVADKPAPTERKEARADAKPVAAKKPAEPRVFVQVGAYAEASTVKSVRQRVDKLGMKAHEQTVETASGQRTRVRLGPFASREEADRAAAKLRAGGLGATVVSP